MHAVLGAKTLCDDVSHAVANLRSCLRSTCDNFEALTRFWALQDHLNRLVQSMSDDREETLQALAQNHPSLLREVIDVISFVPQLRSLSCIAGVTAACTEINESLLTLEYMKQSAPALAASAR